MRMTTGVVLTCLLSMAWHGSVLAGGDSCIREYYTLSTDDGRNLVMYEYQDINAPHLCSIPSGTEVRVIQGSPEGWMLIEYKGRQGCVLDRGGLVLCSGIRTIIDGSEE